MALSSSVISVIAYIVWGWGLCAELYIFIWCNVQLINTSVRVWLDMFDLGIPIYIYKYVRTMLSFSFIHAYTHTIHIYIH